MNPQDIIRHLQLTPHPEGGWYRQIWAAEAREGERVAGTAIYYLLEAGQRSHWHRIDSAEIWHFHAGAPLRLETAAEDFGPVTSRLLGVNLAEGQRPQRIVEAGHWQSAQPLGGWSLVGCTVSPGFLFEHFEMAPPGWRPGSHPGNHGNP